MKAIENIPASPCQAGQEFETQKFAASIVGTVAARQAWWKRRAETAQISPYPLDANKICYAGALLKAGGYRSADLSAMKRRHTELDWAWTDKIQLVVKDALRSCVRGLGPDKQCKALTKWLNFHPSLPRTGDRVSRKRQ